MTAADLKHWKRRALKAEAELESLQEIRKFDHDQEIRMHREIAECRVALAEIADALEFAKRKAE